MGTGARGGQRHGQPKKGQEAHSKPPSDDSKNTPTLARAASGRRGLTVDGILRRVLGDLRRLQGLLLGDVRHLAEPVHLDYS